MKRRVIAGAVFGASFLALAALQIAINPNLFITPGTNLLIDPWVYTGFFLSLPEHLQMFQGTYYGSRLSWLLPGYELHRILPPLLASYVLHLSFFALLLLSTYHFVRRGAGQHAALLVTLLMAWHPIVLAAFSWDYVDGAGMALLVTILWCLEEAVHSLRSRWLWSLAAGVFMTSLVTLNLFLAVLGPVFLLFVLMRAPGDRWRVPIAIAIPAAAGFTAAFAMFAFANVSLGGSWWYLGPQAREAQTLVAARNPWQLPGYSWLTQATWLVLPAAAAISAAIGIMEWSRSRASLTFELSMQVMYVVAAVLWISIQIWSTPVLQLSYYSSYLAPLALIVLPLGSTPARLTDHRKLVVLATATVALFLAGHWLILSDMRAFWNSHAALATAAGMSFAVLAVLALRLSQSTSVRWLMFSCFLAMSYCAAPVFWPTATDAYAKPRFEVTAAAHRFISEHARGRKLRLWYQLQPDEIRPMKSIASTYLWGYVLVNEDLPALTKEQAVGIAPKSRLVLLLPTLAGAEPARAALRQFGLDYTLVTHKEFGAGPTALSVVITDVVAARVDKKHE